MHSIDGQRREDPSSARRSPMRALAAGSGVPAAGWRDERAITTRSARPVSGMAGGAPPRGRPVRDACGRRRMNVVVGTDLLIRSRIAAAVDRARANWSRVDEPIDLPPRTASTLFSSTGGTARRDGPMRSRRVAMRTAEEPGRFSRSTVLTPISGAHRSARAAGLGPMIARSKLVADLEQLVRPYRHLRRCGVLDRAAPRATRSLGRGARSDRGARRR